MNDLRSDIVNLWLRKKVAGGKMETDSSWIQLINGEGQIGRSDGVLFELIFSD